MIITAAITTFIQIMAHLVLLQNSCISYKYSVHYLSDSLFYASGTWLNRAAQICILKFYDDNFNNLRIVTPKYFLVIAAIMEDNIKFFLVL